MQTASLQNIKIAILVAAMALSILMQHKVSDHVACNGCDTPDVSHGVSAPVLVKSPDIVPQDYFQGKDT